MGSALRVFKEAGLNIEFQWKDAEKAVMVGWLKVGRLLEMLDLGQTGSVLKIKLEVDKNPPNGAVRQIQELKSYQGVLVRHDDLPTLFAGKLHTILFRKYIKGRDWFDLRWYLNGGVSPNERYLRNAALQHPGEVLMPGSWMDRVRSKLYNLDWNAVHSDLERFVWNKELLQFFNTESFLEILAARRNMRL